MTNTVVYSTTTNTPTIDPHGYALVPDDKVDYSHDGCVHSIGYCTTDFD